MPLITHPFLIPIDDDSILWRYIDFQKFESLLDRESLFFCRADKFSDPFECTLPKEETTNRLDEYNMITNSNKLKVNKLLNSAKSFNLRIKKSTVVNCWHINNYESDAMWQIYLKAKEGLAIQTTPVRLKNALLESHEKIYASKVRYIDYDNGIWYDQHEYPHFHKCSITPIIHKKSEYMNESEYRLFYEISDSLHDIDGKYWEKQKNRFGKFVKINVNELVDKIIFSPNINEKTKEGIQRLVEEYNYKFEFKDSTLSQNPLY